MELDTLKQMMNVAGDPKFDKFIQKNVIELAEPDISGQETSLGLNNKVQDVGNFVGFEFK
jgi:hypothetical protein